MRPPSDETGGVSETGKALDKVSGLLFPGLGFLIRPLAMFMVIPIYIVLWPIKRKLNPAKHCPNCGLPLMVLLKSDAGFIAKRKADLKAGVRFEAEEKPALAFGREIKLPGDEKHEPLADVPSPTMLPPLAALLEEKKEAPPPVQEETKETPVEKKPVDPNKW